MDNVKTGIEAVAEAIAKAKQAAAMVAPSVTGGKVSRAARKRAFRQAMRDSKRTVLHAMNADGVRLNGAVVRSGRGGKYGAVFFSDYDKATKGSGKAAKSSK
jgi:hypothetical protein